MHDHYRLTCEEVFARLDDFLDRELSEEETRRVEEHLAACAACASEHRFETGVLDGVRAKLTRIAVPTSLRAAILRQIAGGTA
ncbi:MAG: zf-HC2 domain-containing protein [Gemmatimonadetes bacterium]|nr:zf-HC2 domain-containing protein [Gemmatimonadota bacterium]